MEDRQNLPLAEAGFRQRQLAISMTKAPGCSMHVDLICLNTVGCNRRFAVWPECNAYAKPCSAHGLSSFLDTHLSHKNAVLLLNICLHQLTLALPGKGMGVPGESDTTPNSDAKICLS